MVELEALLQNVPTAQSFYHQLAPGYKRRYQSWLAGASSAADTQARLRHIRHELLKGHKTLKIGSYVGDVSLAKGFADQTDLRDELIELSEDATQQEMARFAIRLVRHAASIVGLPTNSIVKGTTAINASWLVGQATFQDARAYAARPMKASRMADDDQRQIFFLMCHQAALTPHVKRHALIAADYCVGVCNFMDVDTRDGARREREWQLGALHDVLRGGAAENDR